MKKVITVFFAVLAVLIVTSTNGQNFIHLTRSDAGQTITLAPDQVLEVNLPEIPSSGYTWCLKTSSNDKAVSRTLTQIGESNFTDNPFSGKIVKNKKMVGQSGTRTLRYVGTMAGTTELTLELKRPMETGKPSVDSYTVTVVSGGKYTGNYKPSLQKSINTHITSTSSSLPSSWDWRPKCTPIENQEQCGDCWAFAGVGVFECNMLITDDSVRDLSEEYLTNCDTEYMGCNGGGCPLDYWMAPKGAVYESEDPWTTSEGGGTTGACGGPYVYHETINSWDYITGENAAGIPPDNNMKEAIYYYGPIWVAVDASSAAWQTYTGGILTENNTNTDHAVVLVGWKDTTVSDGSGGYWILRNSWGTDWGVGKTGYMYITYASDAVGTDAAYMVYKCRNNDFEMMDVTAPVTACGMSAAENVSVQIKFNGCNVVPAGDTLFPTYQADGGAVKNDTIILTNPVNSGDTINYTFHSKANCSALGTHTINCWVKYRKDSLALNDSLIGYTFINRLHQNIDVGVSAINNPVSSCQMNTSEAVSANVEFYGCDSLAAGLTMIMSYSFNGGIPSTDTFSVPHTIYPNGTFTHVFTKTANLSAPGYYTFKAWTEYAIDTMRTNDTLSGYIVKSTSSVGFDTIGFEEPNISTLIQVDTTEYSHAWISTAAAHTGTKGFQMTGGNIMAEENLIQIPDSADVWTINSFVDAKLNFCVDATGWTGFNMRFDLKQTDGGNLYSLYLGTGDYSLASNLRILFNGVQIGGTYNPTTPGSDPWVTHFIEVDSMAGKQFTVTIETRNIGKDTTIGLPFVLDNAYIDNVCFSPSNQVSIKDYNTNMSFGVYPNPFNDAFTLKYDADKSETISLQLMDMLGRVISVRTWNVGMGSNWLDLNPGPMASGMYMIKLVSPKGFAVKNIVKQ